MARREDSLHPLHGALEALLHVRLRLRGGGVGTAYAHLAPRKWRGTRSSLCQRAGAVPTNMGVLQRGGGTSGERDSVLQHLFGVGEEELLSLGASHVCKHLSAAMAKFAEQVFAAGYQQLVSCQGGSCSQIPLVEEELTRAGDQLQRTWQIFLQRASNDAKVELYGLGSVEDVLLDQRRKALELLEQSLREIHHARRVVPFRMAASLT
ncbi:unnamed protein product [Durusdinium trenchii]|uniref:Uncharacterized protein n=1 Tax=Durusdinium trenchii TaxID=1381693 RepID=A0ABP0J738_9DINO